MEKYRKITKIEIIEFLKRENEVPTGCISRRLQTSVYQVRKILKELLKEDKVYTRYIGGGSYCTQANESDPESYCYPDPPIKIWGLIT